MSAVLSLIRTERRGLEQSSVSDPAAWLSLLFGGGPSMSGVDVTEMSALEDPAVLSGVGGVAETLGSLPLCVFKRTDEGREEDDAHPLYPLLHLSPNEEITSMLWREMKQAHLLLNGRAYSEIVRDGAGRVTALWPMHPRRVRPRRDPQTKALVYVIQTPGVTTSAPSPGGPIRDGQQITLNADQVLHLRALSLDGVEGLGRLRLMRESWGLSLALRYFGSLFFGNGANMGGFLEHPGKLSDKARENLRASVEKRHAGLGQSHRLALLEEGLKYHESSMPNNRAQFLESREFQVGETARGLRIPGVMIGHNDKTSTYASAEQFFLSYVVHTVRPWAVRWDQQLTLSLLTAPERKTRYIEHKLDGLLRGDAMTRAQALQIQFQNGALTINEWRALENRNRADDKVGDKHFVMANVVPAEDAGKPPTPPPSPAAQDPAPDPDPDDADEGDPVDRSLLALLVRDTATRAMRRELEGVRKIAEREASDAAAWRSAVDEFYTRHAAYLAEVLHVPLDTARAYTTDHRAALLAEGVAVTDTWNGSAEAALIGLVTRGRNR